MSTINLIIVVLLWTMPTKDPTLRIKDSHKHGSIYRTDTAALRTKKATDDSGIVRFIRLMRTFIAHALLPCAQIVNLHESAGVQFVIKTIQPRRQTSTPQPTFCGQDFLDI